MEGIEFNEGEKFSLNNGKVVTPDGKASGTITKILMKAGLADTERKASFIILVLTIVCFAATGIIAFFIIRETRSATISSPIDNMSEEQKSKLPPHFLENYNRTKK